MSEPEHPLKTYREANKITLEKLAESLGTTKATLSQIENGKRQVSQELLPKIREETGIPAKMLRPDLAEIFDGDPAEATAS
jgi:transcriptional regulator with XRE-family HTH domain